MSIPIPYRRLDRLSRERYGIPGDVLLAKLEKGESGGSGTAVSKAGARAWFQFIPSTRQAVLKATGGKIDPWRSEGEARDAAVLHLTGALGNAPGLEGYNPGGGSDYVKYILGQKVGSSPRLPASPLPSTATSLPAPNPVAGLSQVLQRPQGTVSAPPAPSFSAKVPQPSGYQPAPGVQAPQAPDLRQQLQSLLQAAAPPPYSPAPVNTGLPPLSKNAPLGRVVIAPGADRQGIGLQKPILSFTRKVAGLLASPVTITTGTNHNQFVASTNRQSDHWQGNAADIAVPVDSLRGDHVAASALEALGIPWKRALGMAQKGGLWTISRGGVRYQVIWRTNQGGDHHNHVHLGAAPQR